MAREAIVSRHITSPAIRSVERASAEILAYIPRHRLLDLGQGTSYAEQKVTTTCVTRWGRKCMPTRRQDGFVQVVPADYREA